MKYSKITILISLLFFIFLAFYIFIEQAQAITYGGLGIYPNESEWDPKNDLTRSWFVYTLNLGETKKGKVDIVNSTDQPQEVKIYPVDAATTKDGAFASKGEIDEKVGVGAWVKLAESELSLESGETKTVDFTLSIPENADVGDHMGSIIVQRKGVAEIKREAGEIQPGVQVVTRVGARIYVTVPGEIVRELEFKEFSFKRVSDKQGTFYLTLNNKGNVRISPEGNIEIKNNFSKAENKLDLPQREVFPRDEIVLSVEWKEIPFFGRFVAQASVAYDGRILTKEILFWILPPERILVTGSYSLGGIIVLLIILLITRKIIRRRVRKLMKEYIVKEGETIETIASKFGISWKKLAKINKLKPPYTLKKGQKIFVLEK